MDIYKLRFLLFLILFPACMMSSQTEKESKYIFNIYDRSRERLIPLAIYPPKNNIVKPAIVIVSHGYDRNRGNAYLDYSYISDRLSSEGYYVISIQHELADDHFLAMEGNLYKTRMPNWQRGADNILFTINEIKKIRPDLDWEDVSLIGHSNGGDMSMLFATQHPEYVKRAISLDHRRMPVPLTDKPRLLSLRGCNFEADEGVLPSAADQKKYSIQIIRYNDIKHGDMDDKGSPAQRDTICSHILEFLKNR
ncbi:S9 family peptidase [Prevotella sp. 10(H)]|uniref:alpha/beta hydrolase family protein n=1 Tax=Prevotella sp. 10(H) TaxID=1158294 RepID=UPI0004A76955|nr:alpha/beta hydrolase [Prevotella sp. 10(H)]